MHDVTHFRLNIAEVSGGGARAQLRASCGVFPQNTSRIKSSRPTQHEARLPQLPPNLTETSQKFDNWNKNAKELEEEIGENHWTLT